MIVFSYIAIFSSLLQKSLYLMLIKSDCMLARPFSEFTSGHVSSNLEPVFASLLPIAIMQM